MPLLFGFQQVVEGVLWLTLPQEGPEPIVRAAAFAFCLVASLWPTIFPLALLVRPQDRIRKALLTCLLVLGVALTAYTLFFIFVGGASARVHHLSIRYEGHLPYMAIVRTLYLFVMTATGLLSRYRSIRIFVVLSFLAYVVSMFLYATTLPSVWCFFSAWISFCIVMHLRAQRADAEDLPQLDAQVEPSI